jgi:predicted peptidase
MSEDERISSMNVEHKRTYLIGLSFGCPYSENNKTSNPDFCQFCKMRSLAGLERIKKINSMTDSEVEDSVSHHINCKERFEV